MSIISSGSAAGPLVRSHASGPLAPEATKPAGPLVREEAPKLTRGGQTPGVLYEPGRALTPSAHAGSGSRVRAAYGRVSAFT